MRYGGRGKNKDRSVIHYNDKITITGIPLAAYDYSVNNKTAIDWVMERQSVRLDKTSGIVNDANDFARETMHNPAYPLELLQRVISVSVKTVKIIRNLPELEIWYEIVFYIIIYQLCIFFYYIFHVTYSIQ